MVRREERGIKYKRWALYLPSGPRLQRGKRCLQETVEAGYAKVQMEEVSGTRVDLVWPHAVTWESARRVARLAAEKDSSFHILGCHARSLWNQPRRHQRRSDASGDV